MLCLVHDRNPYLLSRVAWSILDEALGPGTICRNDPQGAAHKWCLTPWLTRTPFLREVARLPFTARIERAHSDRARSASKKGTWPLTPHPSETARSASRRTTRLPSPLLFEQLPKSRLNLVQPLTQVCLKHICLGLHHVALGFELVLEQHQLGK